jgi:hypothetical protein
VFAVGTAAALAVAGAVWAAVTGQGVRTSVASAIFIGGGVLVVVNGLSGRRSRGQLNVLEAPEDPEEMTGVGSPMPFSGVFIGFGVIAIGVLVVVL